MKHILLLHGALGHPNYFEDLKKQLETKFVVHTLTFAGHGAVQLPEGDVKMQDYVDQIGDYCAELDTEQIAIFGYSMGGYAALCYAAAFPQKVTAVMTLATKLDWSPEIAAREVKMLQPDAVAEKVPKFAQYLSSLHGENNWKNLMLAIAGLLHDLGQNPLLTPDVLKGIAAKTQLMVGDKDNMVSIAETQTAFQTMPQANFAVLPNTVHPFEKVNTHLLLQLMNDFFDQ